MVLNGSVVPSGANGKTTALSVEQRSIQWGKYRIKETKNKTTNKKTKLKSQGWLKLGMIVTDCEQKGFEKLLSVMMSCQVISPDVCLALSEILILAFSFYLDLGAGQRVSLYFVTN